MTAAPGRLSSKTPDILRNWQAAALINWKHVDPSLLARNGAVWNILQQALAALDAGWAGKENVPTAGSQAFPSGAQTSPISGGTGGFIVANAAVPRNAPAFAALQVSLQQCAEQFAALPIAWLDLRQMLHTLAAQIHAAFADTDAPAQSAQPPLGAQANAKPQAGSPQTNAEVQAADEERASGEPGDSGLRCALVFYDGALEALAGKVADICIQRLEQEIAEHQEQTFATQHLAERFLGNASHELRTPLTAILGFAELLIEETYGPLTPSQATTVGHIENSAQNLNEIVSNMLDLLHIRAGKLTLQYRPVDVATLLQHLHTILTPLAGRKSVRFHMEIPADIGTAEMDENIVRHIVYHLLSSALRATPAGGEVILRVRRQPPLLVIEAQDTALHLPPDAIATMLDPFPRLENSPTRGYEGWEVGLPLVRRYVELHQGKLRLESLPDTGTIFYVTLPLTRPR